MMSVRMQNAGEAQAVLKSSQGIVKKVTFAHGPMHNNPVSDRALKVRTPRLMQMGAGSATTVTHNLTELSCIQVGRGFNATHSDKLHANKTGSSPNKKAEAKQSVDASPWYAVNRTTGISMRALPAWCLLSKLGVMPREETENKIKARRLADCAQQTRQFIKLDTLARQLGSELCSIKVKAEYKIVLNRFKGPCVIDGQDKNNIWNTAVFQQDGKGKWTAYRFNGNELIRCADIQHGPGGFAKKLHNSVVIIGNNQLALLDEALNETQNHGMSREAT